MRKTSSERFARGVHAAASRFGSRADTTRQIPRYHLSSMHLPVYTTRIYVFPKQRYERRVRRIPLSHVVYTSVLLHSTVRDVFENTNSRRFNGRMWFLEFSNFWIFFVCDFHRFIRFRTSLTIPDKSQRSNAHDLYINRFRLKYIKRALGTWIRAHSCAPYTVVLERSANTGSGRRVCVREPRGWISKNEMYYRLDWNCN